MRKRTNPEHIERLANAVRYYRHHKPALDYDRNFFKRVVKDFRISKRLLNEALDLLSELEEQQQ